MGLALKEQKVDLRSTKDRTEEKELISSLNEDGKGLRKAVKKHFHESLEG